MNTIDLHRTPTIQQSINDRIMIEIGDDADKDGVHHRYNIYAKDQQGQWQKMGAPIVFHKGPLTEKLPNDTSRELPLNGISNEVLLGIVLHRLRVNSIGHVLALNHLEEALYWMMRRPNV